MWRPFLHTEITESEHRSLCHFVHPTEAGGQGFLLAQTPRPLTPRSAEGITHRDTELQEGLIQQRSGDTVVVLSSGQ